MSQTAEATPVPVLEDESAVAHVAGEIAALVRPGAVERDREGRFPDDELAAIARTGFLGIAVPREFGGPELPRRAVARAFSTIAEADPSVAQLLLGHFVLQEALRRGPNPTLRARLYGDVLAGDRLGPAMAERGTHHALQRRTTLVGAGPGEYRLTGSKYYTTGALGSRWLLVGANLDGDAARPVTAAVSADAAGVTFLDDWDAFGQRATASGSILFAEVTVPDEHVLDPGPPPAAPPPTIFGANDQLLHLAIDVGIARAALEDGANFVRTRSRPWFEAKVDAAGQEPHVILRFGQLTTRLHALEALFERAAAQVDAAVQAPALTDENTAAASLAVAEAKAFAQEVAVQLASDVFELMGASATDAKHGLDRHWRNVRTHSLHDPARWKYVHIGNHKLHGINPPRHVRI